MLLVDYIDTSVLFVILHYSPAKCYHWGKGKMYKESPCIVSCNWCASTHGRCQVGGIIVTPCFGNNLPAKVSFLLMQSPKLLWAFMIGRFSLQW